ncbi:MAG: DUF1553 domain-containing protein, partial [Planctomycetales bacterium]
GAGGGPDDRFRGLIDEARIFQRALSAEEASQLSVTETIDGVVAIPAPKRTAAQSDKLRAYFSRNAAPRNIRRAHQELFAQRDRRAALIESFPTVMVMREMETPRGAFILTRGVYDKPGEKVSPGTPKIFPALPKGAPNNRLGFGRWLVDRDNPLTARVTVNRFWQAVFGVGIVGTTEDFGAQGERPSHPGLLDWLAVEFMDSGWDVKALHKTIAMSATYRQSSNVTAELVRRDPGNRLLSRGPRLRLPAQTVRDQALAVSGLLVDHVGGPSVKPYQPEGLWSEIATDKEYDQGHGDQLYRRSLYTYWKRTVAPPTMMVFDASPREICAVRETRTNTPLQALTLMNEVSFVESARVLAERVLKENDKPEQRVAAAFRLATARVPRAVELTIVLTGLDRHLKTYRENPSAAVQLLGAGERPRDKTLDVAELAAYTAITSLILNLDEAVTKE